MHKQMLEGKIEVKVVKKVEAQQDADKTVKAPRVAGLKSAHTEDEGASQAMVETVELIVRTHERL